MLENINMRLYRMTSNWLATSHRNMTMRADGIRAYQRDQSCQYCLVTRKGFRNSEFIDVSSTLSDLRVLSTSFAIIAGRALPPLPISSSLSFPAIHCTFQTKFLAPFRLLPLSYLPSFSICFPFRVPSFSLSLSLLNPPPRFISPFLLLSSPLSFPLFFLCLTLLSPALSSEDKDRFSVTFSKEFQKRFTRLAKVSLFVLLLRSRLNGH